jgi:hypothetical protein
MSVCNSGLSFRYSTDVTTIGDLYTHLDSVDINKHNDLEEFEKDWEGVDVLREGCRWYVHVAVFPLTLQ